MPELAKLEKELAEDVAILGILTDVQNKDSAKKLLDSVELKSPTILFTEELYNSFKEVQFIPYSMFVDSEGKVIGKELVGKQDVDSINEALEIAIKAAE